MLPPSLGPSLRYERSVERRSISPTFCVLRKPPSLRLTQTLTQINLDFCVLHRNSNLKNPLCLSNGRSMARPQVLRWHAPLATYHSQPMTNARPITYATLNPIIISVISSRPHWNMLFPAASDVLGLQRDDSMASTSLLQCYTNGRFDSTKFL